MTINVEQLEQMLEQLGLDDMVLLVRAEQGEDFQEYVFADGTDVPYDTPVGIEYGDKFVLLPNIFFK